MGSRLMIYRDIEYSLADVPDANVWHWRFEISGRALTGRIQTRLRLLAVRKVQQRIDRELKQLRSNAPRRVDDANPEA